MSNATGYLDTLNDAQLDNHVEALDNYLDHLYANEPEHPVVEVIREATVAAYTEQFRRLGVTFESVVDMEEAIEWRKL